LYKFTFWLVSHLVHHPALLENVREEVLPAVQGEQVDEKYLAEQCPKLNALVSETLRLTVTSSLARVILEPTVVGGKMLKPGNKIMVW
jgi:cytochrome P450